VKLDDKKMDEILRLYLPRAADQEVEEGTDRVVRRIRKALQRREEEFGPVDNCAFGLRPMEELALTATDLLGDEAGRLQIRMKVQEITLKPVSYGAVLSALNGLEDRGLIKRILVPEKPQEGVRRNYRFKLTPNGRFALSQARAATEEATDALGDLI
jgi:hypothetical protein